MKTKSKPSLNALNNLVKYGNNRQLDSPKELRISLHKTLVLNTGHTFYHEKHEKHNVNTNNTNNEQIVAATLFPDGHLDITLFIDKIQNQANQALT